MVLVLYPVMRLRTRYNAWLLKDMNFSSTVFNPLSMFKHSKANFISPCAHILIIFYIFSLLFSSLLFSSLLLDKIDILKHAEILVFLVRESPCKVLKFPE